MRSKTNDFENLKGVGISILAPSGKTEKNWEELLAKFGCKTFHSDNLDKLLALVTQNPAKALLMDMKYCEEFAVRYEDNCMDLEKLGTEIIIVTTQGKTDEAMKWARKFQGYFLTTPIVGEEIAIMLERALDTCLLKKRLARYETPEASIERYGPVVVKSPEMKDVVRLARILATRDDSILFSGGIGTGKELMARTVHENSTRRHGPFYSINCRSFSSEDLAVEIFGKGEDQSPETLIEIAAGGTLMLDEIGVISPNVQGKLQRFLEDRSFTRVNARTIMNSDVRIMASTSQSLDEAVAKGEFSEDLYFRLNCFTLHIPSLHRRVEDIPVLTKVILQRIAQEKGDEICSVTEDTLKLLMEYHWPGNVRELENVLDFASLVANKKPIEPKHLPKQFHDEVGSIFVGASIDDLPPVSEIERRYILRVMEATRGNKVKAATILDINRATLHRKLQIYEQKKVAKLG